jgi:hypothetical protein
MFLAEARLPRHVSRWSTGIPSRAARSRSDGIGDFRQETQRTLSMCALTLRGEKDAPQNIQRNSRNVAKWRYRRNHAG